MLKSKTKRLVGELEGKPVVMGDPALATPTGFFMF